MTYYAKYKTDTGELVWAQPTEITDVADDETVISNEGEWFGLVWDPQTLTFGIVETEVVDLPVPPDPFELQQQIDALTVAWLEG